MGCSERDRLERRLMRDPEKLAQDSSEEGLPPREWIDRVLEYVDHRAEHECSPRGE
jgi:hypothetical protein